jgi:hypothetical protein
MRRGMSGPAVNGGSLARPGPGGAGAGTWRVARAGALSVAVLVRWTVTPASGARSAASTALMTAGRPALVPPVLATLVSAPVTLAGMAGGGAGRSDGQHREEPDDDQGQAPADRGLPEHPERALTSMRARLHRLSHRHHRLAT